MEGIVWNREQKEQSKVSGKGYRRNRAFGRARIFDKLSYKEEPRRESCAKKLLHSSSNGPDLWCRLTKSPSELINPVSCV